MKVVKFLRPTKLGTLYNEGEVAGVEDDVADRLVKEKFATIQKAPAAKGGNDDDKQGGQ